MSEQNHVLSADTPLSDPNQDELGYASFAQHLALAILRMTPSDGLVIALNGPWGSGKSTVLNFMLYYLKQNSNEEQPIALHFNPWWFSGREDLTRLLIAQLRARLGDKDFGEIKGKLADLADLISKVPAIPGREVGEFVADKLRGQPDLFSLKERISVLLREKAKKILVIIDDIDRLSPDEIRDLFRTIKATANFPNVIYCLAFDSKIVIDALESDNKISGQRYLEKIVQVPFELPFPDKTSLRRLLYTKLDSLLTDTPSELFDQNYWASIFFEGIDHFIKTPREIVRLINTLRATYPAVKTEVNPIDFIAVEALRIFTPPIYDVIRRNSDWFLGTSRPIGKMSSEGRRLHYENWFNQVPEPEQKAARGIVKHLFPQISSLDYPVFYNSSDQAFWRKQLRICSSDIFSVYFQFTIASDSISAMEIKSLLAIANNSKAFGQTLVEFSQKYRRDGTTYARAILERLQDYTDEDIPQEHILPIVYALFDVGDELLKEEDKSRSLFGFGNNVSIGRIIYQLLRRIDESKRFTILEQGIRNGKALATAEREVSIIGQQHGKFGAQSALPESQQTVNAEHLVELEKLVLEKIRLAASNGSLLQAPELSSILHRWIAWSGDKNEVRKWVFEVTQKTPSLSKFLLQFSRKMLLQTSTDVSARQIYRLNPKWIEPFIDPQNLIENVKMLVNRTDLPQEQQIAANQFIKEFEIYTRGEDPDSSW